MILQFNYKIFSNNLILLFILLSIIFIDWEIFYPNKFEDLNTYYEFMVSGQVSSNILTSPFTFLFRENIFLKLLILLKSLFGNSYAVILFLKIITAFIFYCSLKKYNLPPHISLLLFAPIFIDFMDAQIRNSLACSLAFAGISAQKRKYKILFFLLGIFVHLASLILPIAYLFKNLYLKSEQKQIFKISLALGLSLTLSLFYLLFLFILDDQRLHMYGLGHQYLSLKYFLFGLLIIFICLNNPKQDNFYTLTIGLTIIFSTISGAYFTRYLALFWPLILVELSDKIVSSALFLLIASYATYSFIVNFIIN
jgi:hypothetical protein